MCRVRFRTNCWGNAGESDAGHPRALENLGDCPRIFAAPAKNRGDIHRRIDLISLRNTQLELRDTQTDPIFPVRTGSLQDRLATPFPRLVTKACEPLPNPLECRLLIDSFEP
jgi:hypothetical protein